MKTFAVLLALGIWAVVASSALASTRSHPGALPGSQVALDWRLLSAVSTCTALPQAAAIGEERPLVRPGEVMIESEPGVYIVAPRSAQETTSSPVTARPAAPEPWVSTGTMPRPRPGAVLIESEPGVYIVVPHFASETTTSPAISRSTCR